MRLRVGWRALKSDTRALTIDFIKLVMSLGLGAAIIWAVLRTTDDLLPEARDAAPGGDGGVEMNDWFQSGEEILPLFFLLVAFFGFIVKAVYERRVVR